MHEMLRTAFWLLTAFVSCGVTSAANMALKAPPSAPLDHDWSGSYLRVHLGGSVGHQCAEILEFSTWYRIEGAAGRAAHCPEPYEPVGEGHWQNNTRIGERRKPEAAITPLVRA